MGEEQEEDKPFVYEIGPLKVDLQRSLGFFGEELCVPSAAEDQAAPDPAELSRDK